MGQFHSGFEANDLLIILILSEKSILNGIDGIQVQR